MQDQLVVRVNGEVMLEYDRGQSLPAAQQACLDKMDQKMNAGITYNGQHYASPDKLQCAQFVTMNLIQALGADDERGMAAMCAWLATRLPDLKQVQAVLQNESFTAELIFDKVYAGQQAQTSTVKVAFNPKLN